MAIIRPSANSTFHCDNPNGLKLTRMKSLSITTIHYLLHCPNFSSERLTVFNNLQRSDENILSKDDSNISKVLLLCDNLFNYVKNTSVLTALVEYIISTKRIDASLHQDWHLSVCLYAVCFELFIKLFHLCYLALYFLYLRLIILDYFVKELTLLDFSFFSFYVYLCMFYQSTKICSTSCNK